MIELTYGNTKNNNLMTAMQKLNSYEGFSSKTKYDLIKISKKVDEFVKECGEVHNKNLNKHATKNDKGEVEQPISLSEESMAEFAKEEKELESIELKIDIGKLEHNLLEGVSLSAYHLMALEPFITEEVKDKKRIKENPKKK